MEESRPLLEAQVSSTTTDDLFMINFVDYFF